VIVTVRTPYGVRPCEKLTFGDQLGLVRGHKSKIEDGSRERTIDALATAVADFRLHAGLGLQLVPEIELFLAASIAG